MDLEEFCVDHAISYQKTFNHINGCMIYSFKGGMQEIAIQVKIEDFDDYYRLADHLINTLYNRGLVD